MTRIVVVDDHPVFRKGLVALLRAEGHDVVGEAADGIEAKAVVDQEVPDVVLMDLSMPTLDGFEATAYICASHPDTKVVVITLFDDEDSVVRALDAGASGYVSKQAPPEQITGAVDAVVSDAIWLGAGVARPTLTNPASDHLPGLTPRARDRRLGGPRSLQPPDRRAAAPVDQDRGELRLHRDAQARCR